MILQNLYAKDLVRPPRWLPGSTQYLSIMGSQAYGNATDGSDEDIYGFAIPPLGEIFPHLQGDIPGFGKQKQRFDCWQQHHIIDQETKKEYDFQVFSIVRYFHLLMDNNPNVLDSIFTPINCVVHCTQIGQMVRDNRKMFVHKGLFHKFRGYAFSQLHKMDTKDPEGKRKEIRDKYGWDVKFGSHVVRLMLEAEQLLETGDMDIQRDREMLKAIRRGEWTVQQVRDYFAQKDKSLEELYNRSTLPYSPDEEKIKQLLLSCLEAHYGSLSKAITMPERSDIALREISEVLKKYNIS